MFIASTVSVESMSEGSFLVRLDCQHGDIAINVIPISDDETAQVPSLFSAELAWTNNEKFYVFEQVCPSSETPSTGESLVTLVQARAVKIHVTNTGLTAQKYYVSAYVPTTAS